jgi:hypothetical protein
MAMLAGLAVIAGVAVLLAGDAGALCLLPALALALPLFVRRYPGEGLLTALAAPRCSRRLRAPRPAPPRGLLLRAAPRGGQLIARFLAVRPPPALGPAS